MHAFSHGLYGCALIFVDTVFMLINFKYIPTNFKHMISVYEYSQLHSKSCRCSLDVIIPHCLFTFVGILTIVVGCHTSNARNLSISFLKYTYHFFDLVCLLKTNILKLHTYHRQWYVCCVFFLTYTYQHMPCAYTFSVEVNLRLGRTKALTTWSGTSNYSWVSHIWQLQLVRTGYSQI